MVTQIKIRQISKKTKFDLYSSVRYLSAGFSFLTTILMLRVLSAEQFISFHIAMSCFVILYWFIDLGAIDLVVLAKDDKELSSKYSSGRTFRYIILSALIISALYFLVNPLMALIFISVSTDYFNDSMITYRSLRNSLRYLAFTLIVRKFIPMLFLFHSNLFTNQKVFEKFLLVLFLSNVPWIIKDFFSLPFSRKDIFYFDSKAKFNSLQQGGNFLQNLDLPLLNLLSFSTIIPAYVLGKKLLQIGSVYGQFQIPRIMDVNLAVTQTHAVRKEIYLNYKLSLVMSSFVIFFTEVVARKFMLVNLGSEDRIMAYSCLLISSLSILTMQQNALLKALHDFRSLFISTFLSTLIYLLSIVFLMSLWNQKYFFLMCILLNLGAELLFQELALVKSNKNE